MTITESHISQLRTGDDYAESLRDDRQVFIGGRKIVDVTREPGLRTVVETFSRIYDLQHDDAHRERLTFVEDGKRLGGAWLCPRSREELVWRRQLVETVARNTGGLFGRQPDYVALIALGMVDIADEFSQGSQAFADNIHAWWRHVRENDLALSHAFVDEQSDPNVPIAETDVLRVVEKRSDGVVVRGIKTVATFAPTSDEVFVGALPRPGADDDHMIYFALPIATKGLKVVGRPMYTSGDPANHPVDRFGDENDSILIFDDVVVPADRIFSMGTPAFGAFVFPRTLGWAGYAILARLAVKIEMLTGVASLMSEYIGRDKRPETAEALGEFVRYLTTIRAFLEAAESAGSVSASGYFQPHADFVTAGRTYSVEHYRRIIDQLHDLGTQGLIVMPDQESFDNPELSASLEHLFSSPTGSARERARIFRLAFDVVSSSFGGRQTLFELFNAQPWTLNRAVLLAGTDLEPHRDLARYAAGLRDDVPIPALG